MWNFSDVSQPVKMKWNLNLPAKSVVSHGTSVLVIGNTIEMVFAYSDSNKDISVAHFTSFLENGVIVATNGSQSAIPLTLGTTPSVSMEIVNGTTMV